MILCCSFRILEYTLQFILKKVGNMLNTKMENNFISINLKSQKFHLIPNLIQVHRLGFR